MGNWRVSGMDASDGELEWYFFYLLVPSAYLHLLAEYSIGVDYS
jgi:hypothetical protein